MTTLSLFFRSARGNVAILFGLVCVPLMGLAGAALDYSVAARTRTQLSAAADAAVLIAVKTATDYLNANGVSSGTISQATARAAAVANQLFSADSANLTLASAPQVSFNLSVNSPTVSATLAVSSNAKASMLPILGVSNIPVSSTSTASANVQQYYQVIFVVDISGSMAIGGTPADIAALQAHPKIGCAFACHDPHHYSGPVDTRTIARNAGIKLKIDYVNQAIQTFVTSLTTASNNAPSFYAVGINTFATNFTQVQQVTGNMATVSQAAAAIDVEPVGPANTNWGYTYTTNALTQTLNSLSNVGDGSSPSKRQTFVIFLSDGVEDSPGGSQWGRHTSLTYTSACAALKNAGVTLSTIVAPYPVIPGDTQYNTIVAPISNQLAPTMQTCASSPSWAFVATDGPSIQAAVDKTFNQIIQTVHLTE